MVLSIAKANKTNFYLFENTHKNAHTHTHFTYLPLKADKLDKRFR